MGHGHGNRSRQIDDNWVLCGWLPYVQHLIADIQRKFHFCTGKALRGIFKPEIAVGFGSVLLEQLRTLDGDINNLLLGAFKDLLPLGHRC